MMDFLANLKIYLEKTYQGLFVRIANKYPNNFWTDDIEMTEEEISRLPKMLFLRGFGRKAGTQPIEMLDLLDTEDFEEVVIAFVNKELEKLGYV